MPTHLRAKWSGFEHGCTNGRSQCTKCHSLAPMAEILPPSQVAGAMHKRLQGSGAGGHDQRSKWFFRDGQTPGRARLVPAGDKLNVSMHSGAWHKLVPWERLRAALAAKVTDGVSLSYGQRRRCYSFGRKDVSELQRVPTKRFLFHLERTCRLAHPPAYRRPKGCFEPLRQSRGKQTRRPYRYAPTRDTPT